MGWEMPCGLCPTGKMSALIFLGELVELFLFLGAAAPAANSLFWPTAERLLLGREFPLFLSLFALLWFCGYLERSEL